MILPVQPSAWSHTDEQEQMDEASQKKYNKALAGSKRTRLLGNVDELQASHFLLLMN